MKKLSNALQVVGAALIVGGVAVMFTVGAAVTLGGVFVLAFGVAMDLE